MNAVVILSLLVIGWAAVSQRLRTTVLTGPIVFTVAGLLLGRAGLGVLDLDFDTEFVRLLGEATLVLLLFTDAARIEVPRLRRQAALPLRMLASMPLQIAFGTALAVLVLPGIGVFDAAVLAAVLAPTDAALGQAVVTDSRIPVRIRQTLNVESGLNDGIVLPFITILLGLAGVSDEVEGLREGLTFVASQIGVGVAVGVVIGCGAAVIVDRASARGWMAPTFQQLATLASAACVFALAEELGGNGFIAAFVGGLAFGALASDRCKGVYDFAEREGALLSLIVFAVLGAALLPALAEPLDLRTGVYVLLSLTVVRMVPIALSLLGTGIQRQTFAFLSWFGPRGLATILFGLLVVTEVDLPAGDQVVSIALWTVLASVLAHGLSAAPLVTRYARSLDDASGETGPSMAEMDPAAEFPLRTHGGMRGRGDS